MDLTRFEGHTPGPWRWEFNGQYKCLHLVGGEVRHDLTVIDFSRWGMGGATMRLRDLSHDGMNLLYRVHERPDWIKPEPGREHHKHWHQLLDHRDACLIEAAPELLGEVRRLTDKVADLLRERDELASRNAELSARLAEIGAQKPSMYVLRSTAGSVRPTVVTRTSLLSCAQADRVDAGEDHLDPLFARPAPSAAPERAEPVAAELARMWLVSHYSDGVEAEEIEEKCWEVLGFRDRAIELHDQLRMPMSEAISLAAGEAAGTRSAAVPVLEIRACGCGDSTCPKKGGAA